MRTIPPEMLERVKKRWQVPAENANLEMKVYLSRGFLNELFQVFTIQEGEELTDVDVTVRRSDTGALPTAVFALAVNNGYAEVKSKVLPYDDQYPWVNEFIVASGVSSVAIEFDGYWDRDYKTKKFNFVTENYPWVYYIKDGDLYAQYWQDEPEIIATSVTRVAAIRGWLPANGDQTNDQGLIVSYLKSDGTLWYKGYCIQAEGLKAWEIERQITEFTGTITDLALFRTNDFRVGFIAEIAGQTWWTVTERNFAGMSVWPEFLSGEFVGVTTVDVIEIDYADTAVTEHLSSDFGCTCISINSDSYTVGTFIGGEITGDSEITLTFSQAISGDVAWLKYLITAVSASGMPYTVAKTEYGETDNELVITFGELLDTEMATNLTVGEESIFLTTGHGEMLAVAPFQVSVTLAIDPEEEIYLSAGLSLPQLIVTEIFYSDTPTQDAASLTGEFIGFTEITMTKIGGGDI